LSSGPHSYYTVETEVGSSTSSGIRANSTTSTYSPVVGGIGVANCKNGFNNAGFNAYGTITNSSTNTTSLAYSVPSGQTNDYVIILAAEGYTPSSYYGQVQVSGLPSGCTTEFIGFGNPGAPIEDNITGILCTGQTPGSYTITVKDPNAGGTEYPFTSVGAYVFTSTSTTSTSTSSTSTTSISTTSTTSTTKTTSVSTTKTTTSVQSTVSCSNLQCSSTCAASCTPCTCA
jgi:hypothetical protein